MTKILRVLVGSHAHGLATESSDMDFRGVFVYNTRDLLKLGQKPGMTEWVEADRAKQEKEDSTDYELGHFLNLATHCNPTILEVFTAPMIDTTHEGYQLRELFPYIWHPKGVRNAFIGYGLNQRKKFLEDKDIRPAKYATAYLRTLYQAWVLLSEGKLPLDMVNTPVYDVLKRWKSGIYTKGEVVDTCLTWQQKVEDACKTCDQKQDLGKVNDFLLDIRRRFW